MRGNGLSRLPGTENNGKACGCGSAARTMAGWGLTLQSQGLSLKGSGEVRSPREAPVVSTHRPFRPEDALPPAAAFE
jgi:hypothetical protein